MEEVKGVQEVVAVRHNDMHNGRDGGGLERRSGSGGGGRELGGECVACAGLHFRHDVMLIEHLHATTTHISDGKIDSFRSIDR